MANEVRVGLIWPRPDPIMRSLLNPDELALYDSRKPEERSKITWAAPSALAYLWKNWLIPAVMGGLLVAAIVIFVIGGNSRLTRGLVGILLVVLGVQLAALLVRLWFRTYTRYIITPNRILRMGGIYNRSQSSIEWDKITDLSEKVTLLGQFLRYGTITVETANEASKFGELIEVPRSNRFLQLMNEAKVAKGKPPAPPKATPLAQAALETVVALGKMVSDGHLKVEKTEDGGWIVKRNEPESDEGVRV